MADNLESYFRKKLSEDTPGEDNWNVPSEKVWDKVLPEIQKKRGLFIPWKYLYLAGIILVIGLISLFWFVRPTENNGDTDEAAGMVSTESPAGKTTPGEISGGTETSGQAAATDEAELPPSTTRFGENAKGQEGDAIPGNGEASPEFSPVITIPAASGEPDAGIQRAAGPFDYPEETDTRHDHWITLEGKTIGPIILTGDLTPRERKFTEEPVNEPPALSREPIDNKGKFAVGAFILPTFNATAVQGDPPTGSIETSNMLMYSTNWGLELRYHLSNRFTLVTGIGKSEVKSWSRSAVDFGYDPSSEHIMPTGEKENTSPVPMQTPFGEINTEITYRFSGDTDFPDGEMMNSEIETHQDVRYLSIPLGAEFNIVRFSRFNWFAEGGMRYNRALRDATDFNSRILHNGDEMEVVQQEMTGHPNYRLNFLNFYLGTGLNYQLSESVQLSGSARYFGNVTRVNIQDNMSTFANGFDLKLGVIYIF